MKAPAEIFKQCKKTKTHISPKRALWALCLSVNVVLLHTLSCTAVIYAKTQLPHANIAVYPLRILRYAGSQPSHANIEAYRPHHELIPVPDDPRKRTRPRFMTTTTTTTTTTVKAKPPAISVAPKTSYPNAVVTRKTAPLKSKILPSKKKKSRVKKNITSRSASNQNLYTLPAKTEKTDACVRSASVDKDCHGQENTIREAIPSEKTAVAKKENNIEAMYKVKSFTVFSPIVLTYKIGMSPNPNHKITLPICIADIRLSTGNGAFRVFWLPPTISVTKQVKAPTDILVDPATIKRLVSSQIVSFAQLQQGFLPNALLPDNLRSAANNRAKATVGTTAEAKPQNTGLARAENSIAETIVAGNHPCPSANLPNISAHYTKISASAFPFAELLDFRSRAEAIFQTLDFYKYTTLNASLLTDIFTQMKIYALCDYQLDAVQINPSLIPDINHLKKDLYSLRKVISKTGRLSVLPILSAKLCNDLSVCQDQTKILVKIYNLIQNASIDRNSPVFSYYLQPNKFYTVDPYKDLQAKYLQPPLFASAMPSSEKTRNNVLPPSNASPDSKDLWSKIFSSAKKCRLGYTLLGFAKFDPTSYLSEDTDNTPTDHGGVLNTDNITDTSNNLGASRDEKSVSSSLRQPETKQLLLQKLPDNQFRIFLRESTCQQQNHKVIAEIMLHTEENYPAIGTLDPDTKQSCQILALPVSEDQSAEKKAPPAFFQIFARQEVQLLHLTGHRKLITKWQLGAVQQIN